MGAKSDIERYGRRVRDALPTEEQQHDMRRFVEALTKLASEVEDLESRLRRVEARTR